MRYSSKISFPILCPIRFEAVELLTETYYYPRAFDYLQKWTTATDIHVQCFHELTGKSLTLRQKYLTGEVKDQAFTQTSMSTGVYCYDAIMKPLMDGVCYFQVLDSVTIGDVTTTTVIADSILGEANDTPFGYHMIGSYNNLVTFNYWNSSNDFNTRFDSYQYTNTFNFCVEGGFIPNKFEPKNDMKVFTDSLQQDSLGFSSPSSVRSLSMGDGYGLPSHHVELINFIFACDVTLIRNIQWQATEAVSVEEVPNGRLYTTISLKRKTNLFMQNYGGVIYITDRYGNIITLLNNGEDKSSIL